MDKTTEGQALIVALAELLPEVYSSLFVAYRALLLKD